MKKVNNKRKENDMENLTLEQLVNTPEAHEDNRIVEVCYFQQGILYFIVCINTSEACGLQYDMMQWTRNGMVFNVNIKGSSDPSVTDMVVLSGGKLMKTNDSLIFPSDTMAMVRVTNFKDVAHEILPKQGESYATLEEMEDTSYGDWVAEHNSRQEPRVVEMKTTADGSYFFVFKSVDLADAFIADNAKYMGKIDTLCVSTGDDLEFIAHYHTEFKLKRDARIDFSKVTAMVLLSPAELSKMLP